MPYKDPVKAKAYKKLWNEKHREEQRLYNADYLEQNKEKNDAARATYRDKNREELNEKEKTRKYNIMTLGLEMISTQVINDKKTWSDFCNRKRKSSKKYPYSEDFTDDIFFDKMKDGCIYCGDPATTIDRLDSSLDHIPQNCVGCCQPCNSSKNNSDLDTFMRKAFYRTFGEYFDEETDIWSDNIRKPRYDKAKKNSQRQNREFALTHEDWDVLSTKNCEYCRRSRPCGKWFGVDRVIPDGGYTLNNTVSCCPDCNYDKWVFSVEEMKKRNEQIANRLRNGVISLYMI